MTTDLLSADAHFEFGKNWKDFLSTTTDEHFAGAERGLCKLLPEGLEGKTFLDIGCGSGIHLRTAERLGAKATGVDIDPDSVAAAKSLGCNATVCSVFDLSAGQYDVVYSWGVLHHTGSMWPAVEAAAKQVKPGGIFVIALYRKTPMCGFWAAEKKVYMRAPRWVQAIAKRAFLQLLKLSWMRQGLQPSEHMRTYKTLRGMNVWHDIHDWLGGYPYESATSEETEARLNALGFDMVRSFTGGKSLGILGAGCAEYVAKRR